MKPVHTYHVPTYSIVPPYQFARFQKIEFLLIILTADTTLLEREQLLRKRQQNSSTIGLTSRCYIFHMRLCLIG